MWCDVSFSEKKMERRKVGELEMEELAGENVRNEGKWRRRWGGRKKGVRWTETSSLIQLKENSE